MKVADAIFRAQLTEKTVYLLGAGTSRWAGAPLMSEFKASAYGLKLGEDASGVANYVEDPVGDEKFRRALELWEELAPESNVEELYVMAQLLNALAPPDQDDEMNEAAGERLHCVEYMIAKTLQRTVHGEAKETKVHDHMLERISGPLVPPARPAILSLNWDLSIEEAASRIGLSIDLGLDKPILNAMRLLKLHGSLNWTYNGDTGEVRVEPHEKSLVKSWDHLPFHDLVGSGEEPVFVPPTTEKLTMDSGPLAGLWRQAQGLLEKCHRLVIIGYSFPATDVQFRMFLKQALQTNKALRSIHVVNAPAYGTKRQQFEDHYATMFAGSAHFGRLKFVFQTYEDWVQGGCILVD